MVSASNDDEQYDNVIIKYIIFLVLVCYTFFDSLYKYLDYLNYFLQDQNTFSKFTQYKLLWKGFVRQECEEHFSFIKFLLSAFTFGNRNIAYKVHATAGIPCYDDTTKF